MGIEVVQEWERELGERREAREFFGVRLDPPGDAGPAPMASTWTNLVNHRRAGRRHAGPFAPSGFPPSGDARLGAHPPA